MNNIRNATLSLLAATVITALPSSGAWAGDRIPVAAAEAQEQPQRQAAQTINGFGGKLFQTVAESKGNLLLSPYSVTRALLMAAAGARGATQQELAAALGINPASAPSMEALAELAQRLGGDGSADPQGCRLSVADSLWADATIPVKPAYQKRLQTEFAATVLNAPFAADLPQAVKLINRWIEENTGGMLRNLLSPAALDPSTRMMLCDAVYFDGKWPKPFPQEQTREEDFHAEGERVRVSMMHRTLDTGYEQGATCHAVRLLYRGGAFSLIVALPRGKGTLAQTTAEVFAKHPRWFQSPPCEVVLSLPRFSFDALASLKESAQAIGIRRAFSPQEADFTDIAQRPGQPLYLNALLHGGKIEVNEAGTRAAATTLIPEAAGCMPSPKRQPVIFTVDKPFFFLLRHEPSGLILFAGRVVRLPDVRK